MKKMPTEWKLVLLLAILFGIIGLDRFAVVYLFPVIVPELKINNTQAGAIASILAFTYAISTWLLGSYSDRHGRKGVLIFSTVFFSVMTWLTGIAKSFTAMLAIRGLLGIGEGGVFSTSVAAISENVKPEKKGLMMGVHQAFFPLLGIGLGPIIATQLNEVMPWEAVFFVVGIPGILLAYGLHKVMKNKPIAQPSGNEHPSKTEKSSTLSVLKVRNVWVATLMSCCFQSGLYVFSTFVALYLTQVVHLELSDVGFIISGWGFGGAIGMIIMPSLSDRLGRKPVVFVCSAIYGALMYLFAFSTGLSQIQMFLLLGFAGIFGFGLAPIYLAIIPAESVPAQQAGSAVGIPTGVGEMAGGVIMPIVAGGLADLFGLHITMEIVGAAFTLIAILSVLFIETAPVKTRRRQVSLTANS
ncbi:Predicted arabinose efflux permease, MFS family [Vibrio xiamenensis]|uniref:Predicted arabinose efflux permease, MFS family n=1 Tax=Vibrio xiamenensis TaxID=861298 RepID=A0A1G8GE07_9VIBR|nr:MFS transporter [Vibrio xiamenensis]SDH92566.1 Predicted arabinose efflux permease, MFS family [Vibrio xiamenensis]